MPSEVIYLVGDGETEWEVTEAEWLTIAAEQGFTAFNGPEYTGRRLVASGRAGIARTRSVPETIQAIRAILLRSLTKPHPDGKGVLTRPGDDSAMLDRALAIIADIAELMPPEPPDAPA